MQCQGLTPRSQRWPGDHPREVRDLNAFHDNHGLTRIRRHIWEAIRHVWPEAHWPGEENFAGIESRL